MNDTQQRPAAKASVPLREAPADREGERPESKREPFSTKPGRHTGRRLLGAGTFLLLCAALAVGFWQHYRLHAQVMATAEERRDFVPSVRAAPVRASASTTGGFLARHHRSLRASQYLRAGERLHLAAQGRHRQPRQGRRPTCRDHGPRA